MSKTDSSSNSNTPKKTGSLLDVAKSFTKIGLIGFGGGSALIPVIEKEVVIDNNYVTEEEYTNFTVISNITPGALPVKLGALVGYEMAGVSGMLTAALLTSIPGVFITLIMLLLIDVLGDSALHIIEQASIGIFIFIIFLLAVYIKKIMNDSKKNDFTIRGYLLMLLTFFLTMGKEIRSIISAFHIDNAFTNSTPLFDISTINMLILIFFIIFFTGGKSIMWRNIFTAVATIIYVLMFGKMQLINPSSFGPLFQSFLLAIAVAMLIIDSKKDIAQNGKVKIDFMGAMKKSLPFIIMTAVVFAIVMIIEGESMIFYLINGTISTITSFGGGEAYLTVADGIFVEGGLVSSAEFYGQVLPIANALPGSILVKILSAIGFMIGKDISAVYALLAGTLGLVVATMASCVICIIVGEVYNSFSYLNIFKILKLWILPVICGLLLSTILSMLIEAIHICVNSNMSYFLIPVVFLGIFFGIEFLHKKFHLNDVILIILSALVSVGILNII